MAKVHEEVLVIKLSKLVREDLDITSGTLASPDVISALEQVAQEFVGNSVLVEVVQA